ncbi:MAG: UDP-N-acetylglucosamine 2-epimerase (non-hydrolyzing) [Bacteroidales bacterium]|nr:UDP-N-acetylglucosamine 2-epimerase (non-hydrolyzing) [Bacteroidales bacterium]
MEGNRLKILTVVGARPQIIKAAAISRAIKNAFTGRIVEKILHTGQHYDTNMSEVFFSEMGIPAPDYNLNVGSATHGSQTALMISGIEKVLVAEKPDLIILFGDTNSTLAGAIAASKLHVPVAHIEAGLRSFNKAMPEEINRIMCDHASTWLFVPTIAGLKNLKKEGFDVADSIIAKKNVTIDNPGVYHTGDVMYDNSLYFSDVAEEKAPLGGILRKTFENGYRRLSAADRAGEWHLKQGEYILATIHRDNNTDYPERLNAIFRALADIAEGTAGEKGVTVVVPLHPRTEKMLEKALDPMLYERVVRLRDRIETGDFLSGALSDNPGVLLLPPASFFEMISLEKGAKMVITDSGGVQKEAFFFRKPSLILRHETEWVEIVECGAAKLVDADYNSIIGGYFEFLSKSVIYPEIFGDGRAAEKILSIISGTDFSN